MNEPSDCYEEQLCTLFKSYDESGRGVLDEKALQKLCDGLHLDNESEQALLRNLFNEHSDTTFSKFRDALLLVLSNNSLSEDHSLTDREVSPKFVFGNKKYGRRSRPSSLEDSFGSSKWPSQKLDEMWSDDGNNSKESLFDLRLDESDIDNTSASPIHQELMQHLPRFGSEDQLLDDMGKDYMENQALLGYDATVELLENGGVSNATALLSELAIEPECDFVNLSDLTNQLHDGLTNMQQCIVVESLTPHVLLLQACLAINQQHIKLLISRLEQMQGERDKLKNDLIIANDRASLLAQEVDDRHARLEDSTQQLIKNLEDKHGQQLKKHTLQWLTEKDQLVKQYNELSIEIQMSSDKQNEVLCELTSVKEDCERLEKENRSLIKQLAEVESCNNNLELQVSRIPSLEQKILELEESREQVEMLCKKIQELQEKNIALTDDNDELTLQIHNILHKRNIKVLNSTKRRGDNRPLNEDDTSSNLHLTLSPKIPKYQLNSGIHALNDDDFTSPSTLDNKEYNPDDNSDKKPNETLEECLEQVQTEILKMLSEKRDCNRENCDLKMKISKLIKHLAHSDETHNMRLYAEENASEEEEAAEMEWKTICDMEKENNEIKFVKETEEEKLKQQNEALTKKCEELENCLELLRSEYDECENYWQSKIDEERMRFDMEQRQSDEKFVDLQLKIKEYADMYENTPICKLPAIAEQDNLEKQVTDLQDEFRDYKKLKENEMKIKDDEIDRLKTLLLNTMMKYGERSSICAAPPSYVSKTNNNFEGSSESVRSDKTYTVDNTHFNNDEEDRERTDGYSVVRHLNRRKKNLKRQCNRLCGKREQLLSEISRLITCTHVNGHHEYPAGHVIGRYNEMKWSSCYSYSSLCNAQVKQKSLSALSIQCKNLKKIIKENEEFHRKELEEYKSALSNAQDMWKSLQQTTKRQTEQIMESDKLVKDLYCENAHLLANIHSLENQHINSLGQFI